MNPHEKEQSRQSLIEEIGRAFEGVSREDGVTLHEAAAVDDYGTDEERAQARTLDTESRWQDVPDRDVEQCSASLHFMDAKGFRYYLPVYMIWVLKHCPTTGPSLIDETIQSLVLTAPSKRFFRARIGEMLRQDEERFGMFSEDQARAVCRFLRFMTRHGQEQSRLAAQEALDRYWARFCD